MEKLEIERVENYLKKMTQRDNIELRQLPGDTAEVFLGDELIATVLRDEEDGDLSYQFQMKIDAPDIAKTETYLKDLFQRDNVDVRQLPKKDDTAEVYLGEEFIATLYNDLENGKIMHQFQMCILDFDLDEEA
ncbi:MAG: DUF3126 family protein [Methyloligellaceae bacterium]